MTEVHLDLFYDVSNLEQWRNHTSNLYVKVFEGRLSIYMDDHCDQVEGFFRSVEDIELVIKELQNYVDGVKNGNS